MAWPTKRTRGRTLPGKATLCAYAMASSLVAGLVAGVARGDGEVEAVRLDFAAHEGCPDKDAFFAGVRARTARVRHAAAGEAARIFRVRVTRDGHRSQGELGIFDELGQTDTRSIEGESCSEVMSALALIAALSIDPSASSADAPASRLASPPSAAPGSPLAESATADRTPAAAPRSLQGPAEARWVWTVGVQGGAVAMGDLGVTFSSTVFVDGSRNRGARLGPSWRLGFTYSDGNASSSAGTDAGTFRWWLLNVSGCPFAATLGNVSLRPCLSMDAGVLHAVTDETLTTDRGWFSAGLLGRAEWVPLGSFHLEAQAGAMLPLVRDPYFIQPATLYEVPAVAAVATLGLGVTIP
jgi:hypothetical protein